MLLYFLCSESNLMVLLCFFFFKTQKVGLVSQCYIVPRKVNKNQTFEEYTQSKTSTIPN